MVRDPKVHEEVIRKVMSYAQSIGFLCRELEFSPIKGPEGNIEYLLHLQKGASQETEEALSEDAVEKTVALAHAELD